ncbi:MAG: hypothetical protein V7K21_21965 [Nostoc sp.]|uniref:hypothetical protein n=1 Tax=Nostoc sp. TaxID=1180 RepID=UPI002FF5B033
MILLFNKADTLFDKPSEVIDSRDSYANIEVNYLLQRYVAIALFSQKPIKKAVTSFSCANALRIIPIRRLG